MFDETMGSLTTGGWLLGKLTGVCQSLPVTALKAQIQTGTKKRKALCSNVLQCNGGKHASIRLFFWGVLELNGDPTPAGGGGGSGSCLGGRSEGKPSRTQLGGSKGLCQLTRVSKEPRMTSPAISRWVPSVCIDGFALGRRRTRPVGRLKSERKETIRRPVSVKDVHGSLVLKKRNLRYTYCKQQSALIGRGLRKI